MLSFRSNDFLIDLAYTHLVVALIDIAEQAENNELKDVIVSGEKSEYDEKISYRLQKLKKRLLALIRRNEKYNATISPLREKLLKSAIEYSEDTLQPDYLAVYMLRFRFVLAKRTMNEQFVWLLDKRNDLVDILELLDSTSIGSRDEEMCELACKISKSI